MTVNCILLNLAQAQWLGRPLECEEILMTFSNVDRAVSEATGESVRTIARLGFSLTDLVDPHFDPEPTGVAKFLDWDRVARRRYQRLGVH